MWKCVSFSYRNEARLSILRQQHFRLVCVWHAPSYRITGFFCGCKFLRFVSKIGTCNFCDFIFCDFTPWQSDLYSLDDMKNFLCHLKRPDFYMHVHLSWSQAHFPLYWTHQSITQEEKPVSCSCEQKLIGPGMTQAVGSHSSWFELRKLGTCVFNHGIKRGCSLRSPCLYQWKQYTSKWN